MSADPLIDNDQAMYGKLITLVLFCEFFIKVGCPALANVDLPLN
jgi:hypothetical protein